MKREQYINEIRQHFPINEATAGAILELLRATDSTIALRQIKKAYEDRMDSMYADMLPMERAFCEGVAPQLLTCHDCARRKMCAYADDPYNTNGDCLAEK